MKSSDKISVIVPIYNIKQEYLEISLQSIIKQTYRELEIILIDDGSPDNCGDVCDEYAKIDDRIIVIHQENKGVSFSRNAGLEIATGRYIMFVDPDDYLEGNCIEYLYSCMSGDADIIACCCNVIEENHNKEDHFFDGDGVYTDLAEMCANENGELELRSKKELYFQLMRSDYGQPQYAYTAIGVPWGKLYRTEFLRKFDLHFDTSLPRMQDNMFNMYAFCRARIIIYKDIALYNYRYEHISGLFTKTGSEHIRRFSAVAKARFECLTLTGLINDPDINAVYYCEASDRLVDVLFKGVFYPDNRVPFSEKKNTAVELVKQAPFKDLIESSPELSLSTKQKIYMFSIRNNMWRMFEGLCALKAISMRLKVH